MADIFTALYQQYRDQIFYYFYRTLQNPHLAEELTHDTFLKALRGLDGFRGESSLKNWLYTIAANTYRNHLAKRDTIILESHHLNHAVVDDMGQVAEQLLIEQVFKQMNACERELITLRDVSAFSYTEIAGLTGLTEGQVRVRLHRARKKFRTLYKHENRGD